MENSHRGFLSSELRSKGEYCDWMGIYAGGTYKPSTPEVLKENDHQLKFVKKFPPELNPDVWSDMAQKLAAEIGEKIENVDHFFITQININSIWATMDILGIDRSKAHTVMHEYGYTGSACIPMALKEAVKNDKIKEGDLCFFIGSGGGLTFASAAFRF
jgi:3-oxoacyl-[acyl-carrier-protein] synthase-3